MRSLVVTFFTLSMIAFSVGCQSGSSPALPDPGDKPDEAVQTVVSDSENPVKHLWGYYHCVADLGEGTISALPSRTADVHINATKILNKQLGLGVEILPDGNPASGYFVLNISITHPFPGDKGLTGFDVKGILLSTGEHEAGGLKFPGLNDPHLLNADGWTRWWNQTEFTDPGLLGHVPGNLAIQPPSGTLDATVNGYKLFCDALVSDVDPLFITSLALNDPAGRAVFRSGKTNSRRYEIQFPVDGGPKVYFDYAIEASWAQPSPDPPVDIPADFPIWANAFEAFLVGPTVTNNTLAGTPFGGAGSGVLELSIEVWDWQGWSNGSYAGQIGSVKLHSPYVKFDTPLVEQVDGFHKTVLTVTASCLEATVGTVPILIEIPAPGTAWKQGWQAAPDGEVATYSLIMVDIGLVDCTPDENVMCEDAEPVELQDELTSSVCMPHDPSDYYRFEVPGGTLVDGTVILDNFSYADNDLILYNGCPGDPTDMALTPGTISEMIELVGLESGTYYIAVLTGELAGTEVQPYILTLNLQQAQTDCTTDDNNEYTNAVFLELSDSYSETVCAGMDMRDWFKIDVPHEKVAGGTIFIDNAGDGDVNIRVYDEYPGPVSFWSVNPDTQDEMVNISGLSPGMHYIEVYAQGSSPTGDRGFTIETNLITSGYNCTVGDGNDSPLVADPIGYTDSVSDTVCYPADPDWYVFIVDESKAASGTITLSGSLIYDNDLYLYGDPDESPIEYCASVGIADEIMTLDKLGSGTYYLKAAAHPVVGGGDQDYTLTMDLEEEAVGEYDFNIHAHIICKTDGSSPATSEGKVQDDVDWADVFYSQWGGSITLVEVSYINRSKWLAASTNEMYSCHMQYRDTSGPINVYYVNSFTDLANAAAYCRMDCRYYYQTHNSTYVVMSDYADHRTLAHELGHGIGILHDTYLLDAGFNSCSQINYYYCPYPPNGSYCDEDDAEWGNLMYFGVSNWTQPYHYHLSDLNWENPEKPIQSQVENWAYFHAHYPNNF